MKIIEKSERRNAELQRIRDLKERLWKRISRTVKAYDKVVAEEKRLLKPRKLEAQESLKITSEEYHKIREQDFSDDIPDFLRREAP